MTSLTYNATRKITPEHVRSELVVNGDMSSSTGWTLGAGWAISGGLLTHTPGNTATASQNTTLVSGYIYIVTYEVSGRTAGSVIVSVGSDDDSSRSTNATFSYSATASTNGFTITPTTDFDGSIDNLSIILTSVWSMDVYLSDRPVNFKSNKNTSIALDGATNETIYHSTQELYALSSLWFPATEWESEYWEEFVHSIVDGSVYVLDLKGTIASPDNQVNAIMIGAFTREENRIGWYKVGWNTLITS